MNPTNSSFVQRCRAAAELHRHEPPGTRKHSRARSRAITCRSTAELSFIFVLLSKIGEWFTGTCGASTQGYC